MSDINESKTFASWKTIIIFLIFFWPVGFYLLYKKIKGDKAAVLQNSKALNRLGWFFIAFAGLSIAMVVTGDMQISDMLIALIFFGGGGTIMIYIAKKMRTNAEKLKKYIAIVINNNQTSIDNIAAAIPTDYNQAVKDLQMMIDKGYFESAYIDITSREIILPKRRDQQIHENYSDSSVKQPQAKVVICKSCGANNRVVEGQVCECEFCGSPLE